MIDLIRVITDVADELAAIDASKARFKTFQPGVGPYGEPQLVRELARRLNARPEYGGKVATKRTPDLLIRDEWGVEFKIARPFGDNAREAENWSVNLLHPYRGSTSLLGDCIKLRDTQMKERKAVAVIGYEHSPPKIELAPLVRSFEVLATQLVGLRISERVEIHRNSLVHPVHQQLGVFAWEILDDD